MNFSFDLRVNQMMKSINEFYIKFRKYKHEKRNDEVSIKVSILKGKLQSVIDLC